MWKNQLSSRRIRPRGLSQLKVQSKPIIQTRVNSTRSKKLDTEYSVSKPVSIRYSTPKYKLFQISRVSPLIQVKSSGWPLYSSYSIANRSSRARVNQDSVVFVRSFSSKHMGGVMDGHGPEGHLVAEMVQGLFKSILRRVKYSYQQFDLQHQAIILRVFRQVSQALEAQSKVNVYSSGCTCTALFFNKNNYYLANIGDSRLALIRNQQGLFETVFLSVDHKPELPSQKQRILRMGGKIRKSIHNPSQNLMRFYNKSLQGPGLALTRAFGDLNFAGSGLISIPDIFKFSVRKQDEVLLIGSDGLFQFMSKGELAETVKQKGREPCANRVCNAALKKWLQEMGTSDDISCVAVNLNNKQN